MRHPRLALAIVAAVVQAGLGCALAPAPTVRSEAATAPALQALVESAGP